MAVLAFGARLALRRGARPQTASQIGADTRRLRTLERYRRRAKRAWLASPAADSYSVFRRRWDDYRAWLRASLNGKPINAPSARARRRCVEILDLAVKVTKRELLDDGITPPPDKPLRRMVRKTLRHIRRDRVSLSVVDVLRSTLPARRFLVWYVCRLITIEQQQDRRQYVPSW